ncbi:hypothetical protein [Agriterribacter sp.]|uniref:hypothetical protein n=1 Tax=Agriterribacter sp. TaxID=2821509 RepID=UPI002C8A8D3D|nr:hypothetical protein [Agriterribacter sp.]HTN07917.1 hypothetical protein [Agriterribacter sp.]
MIKFSLLAVDPALKVRTKRQVKMIFFPHLISGSCFTAAIERLYTLFLYRETRRICGKPVVDKIVVETHGLNGT